MVRSDLGGAGVMFSIDTETGFDKVVLINAAWGLGENVVQGAVDPDEYDVFKPLLADPSLTPIIEKKLGDKAIKMIYARRATSRRATCRPPRPSAPPSCSSDEEILPLARWAVHHRGALRPPDGHGMGEGRRDRRAVHRPGASGDRAVAARGRRRSSPTRSASKGKKLRHRPQRSATRSSPASVCLIEDVKRHRHASSTARSWSPRSTDPDWVPIMKRAAAIVTDHGGRTSHAAIVSRELGLPAIVGTGNATHVLHDGQEVTVSCAEGDEGFVYEGTPTFEIEDARRRRTVPATQTRRSCSTSANPAAAFRWWRLPADGVGLARMEFVITNHIRVHPMALVQLRHAEGRGGQGARSPS